MFTLWFLNSAATILDFPVSYKRLTFQVPSLEIFLKVRRWIDLVDSFQPSLWGFIRLSPWLREDAWCPWCPIEAPTAFRADENDASTPLSVLVAASEFLLVGVCQPQAKPALVASYKHAQLADSGPIPCSPRLILGLQYPHGDIIMRQDLHILSGTEVLS